MSWLPSHDEVQTTILTILVLRPAVQWLRHRVEKWNDASTPVEVIEQQQQANLLSAMVADEVLQRLWSLRSEAPS